VGDDAGDNGRGPTSHKRRRLCLSFVRPTTTQPAAASATTPPAESSRPSRRVHRDDENGHLRLLHHHHDDHHEQHSAEPVYLSIIQAALSVTSSAATTTTTTWSSPLPLRTTYYHLPNDEDGNNHEDDDGDDDCDDDDVIVCNYAEAGASSEDGSNTGGIRYSNSRWNPYGMLMPSLMEDDGVDENVDHIAHPSAVISKRKAVGDGRRHPRGGGHFQKSILLRGIIIISSLRIGVLPVLSAVPILPPSQRPAIEGKRRHQRENGHHSHHPTHRHE
jgi:hypothetical protein